MKHKKMKHKNQFRQGDVLIERVNQAPTGTVVAGRPILAHGEVTGHAHEIEDASAAVIEEPREPFSVTGDLADAQPMTRLIARLGRKTQVKHQEHAPIPTEKGTYRVTRQREYSPQEIRNVAD